MSAMASKHRRLDCLLNSLPNAQFNTETKMSSFWRNFNHWLHWKLSFWQLPVQPVMKISSKWRHFRFSEREHQSSAAHAFVRGIHRWSPRGFPSITAVTRKMFLFYVIMPRGINSIELHWNLNRNTNILFQGNVFENDVCYEQLYLFKHRVQRKDSGPQFVGICWSCFDLQLHFSYCGSCVVFVLRSDAARDRIWNGVIFINERPSQWSQ